jgi:hypothetical protein
MIILYYLNIMTNKKQNKGSLFKYYLIILLIIGNDTFSLIQNNDEIMKNQSNDTIYNLQDEWENKYELFINTTLFKFLENFNIKNQNQLIYIEKDQFETQLEFQDRISEINYQINDLMEDKADSLGRSGTIKNKVIKLGKYDIETEKYHIYLKNPCNNKRIQYFSSLLKGNSKSDFYVPIKREIAKEIYQISQNSTIYFSYDFYLNLGSWHFEISEFNKNIAKISDKGPSLRLHINNFQISDTTGNVLFSLNV